MINDDKNLRPEPESVAVAAPSELPSVSSLMAEADSESIPAVNATVELQQEEMPVPPAESPHENIVTPPSYEPRHEAPTAAEPPPAVQVPPTEAQEEPDDEHRLYWHRILTGNPDTVPQEVRERAGAEAEGLSREERDYILFSAVNRSWVVDKQRVSREAVMADWKTHRAELAAKLGVADDEREVFMALSEREGEAPRREMARTLYAKAYTAGIQGSSKVAASDIPETLSPKDRELAETLVGNAYEEGLARRKRWLPLARELAEGMDVFAAVEEDTFSAPRVFAGAPELLNAVDTLADMNDDDRHLVLRLANEMAREARVQRDGAPEEEGVLSRAQRAVRRGATSMGFGIWQAIGHAGVASLDNLGSALGGEWGQNMQEGAKAWDRRMQMLNEIRHLTQQETLPLLSVDSGRAETFFIDAAQALPAAVLSCCGGAGFGALALSGMGESVAEARRRAPEGKQQLQLAAGVVAGAVQGAIYMGMSRIGGKMLEQSVANFMKARGSGLVNYSLAGLKSMAGVSADGVKLMLAGKAAAAADLGAHELAARAAGTASNIDWEQFGNNLTDIECNMREAASVLPFLLIGAGRAALRHFRSPEAVLGSGRKLLEWKVDEKTVEAILREPNIDTRNTMLQEALRESELWKDNRRYSLDIHRAMSLLNTNGMPVFRDRNTVCDFLRLPARFATPPAPRSAEAAPGAAERTRQGLQLRDEWERLAGFWKGPGELTEMRVGNGRGYRALMNGRGNYASTFYFAADHPLNNGSVLRRDAAYAPQAEATRREVLTAHFDEMRSLSYRLLWQFYGADAMLSAEGRPIGQLQTEAEHTRREFLSMVSSSIIARAAGETEKVVFERQSEACGKLLRRYSGRDGSAPQEAAAWLSRVPDYLVDDIATCCLEPDNSRMASHPELRDFYWLMYRARVCTAVLGDLLPMSDDFQAMLARGFTPAGAYEHLLKRELSGDSSESSPELPLPAADVAVTARNAERAALYTRMTGFETESAPGDDGQMLYRMRQPNGDSTHWHSSEEAAMNELAGNAAFAFMPMGTPVGEVLQHHFDSRLGAAALPVAGELEYSGHDQLCGIALRELARSWLADASHRQPTLVRERVLRANLAFAAGEKGDVKVEAIPDSPDYRLEANSALSPFGIALGRFKVFWHRQLTEGLLSPDTAADFLVQAEVLSPEECREIMAKRVPPKMPRRRDAPLKDTPPPDIAGADLLLSEAMATFTLRYFASRLMELDLPQSVKSWYALAAFSPVYEGVKPEPGKRHSLPFRVNRTGSNLLSLHNHRQAVLLQELAPHAQRYRERFASGLPEATIARLMPAALSQDRGLQAEQAWSHSLCGESVFHDCSEKHWSMLRFPSLTWEALTPAERDTYVSQLATFCVENPLSLPEDFAAMEQDTTELVQSALSNLDAVLSMCPDLHRYSFRSDDDSRIRSLTIDSPGLEEYQGQYATGDFDLSPETRANYSVEHRDMPLFIASSPRVQHALHVLDLLRAFPGRKPYSDGHRICWGDSVYGSEGKAPAGLEFWSPRPALRGLRHIFHNMRIVQAKTDADVVTSRRGDPLPWLDYSQFYPTALEPVTVYESDFATGYVYRLMPGMVDAAEPRARLPYLVGVREGVHVGVSESDLSGSLSPQSFMPLHSFVHKHYPLPVVDPEEQLALRRRTIVQNLERLLSLADRKLARVRPADSVRADMTELLMRLYEDTGFSESLLNFKAKRLTTGRARAVRLAANVFACLEAPDTLEHSDTVAAFQAFRETADMLRQDRRLFLSVVEALATGGRATSQTTGVEAPPKPPVDTEAVAEARRNAKTVTALRRLLQGINVELPADFELTPDKRQTIVEWLEALRETGWYDFDRARKRNVVDVYALLGIKKWTKKDLREMNEAMTRAAENYDRKVADPEWKRHLQEKREHLAENVRRHRVFAISKQKPGKKDDKNPPSNNP
ncbi:MAG: hypothetical protein Q4F38_07250 [Akkermansia sp.]|nr:hypothetical protein [Akkermansia sp.]